jgi:Taurine catabolism dioxygenase TauD, TfdA family
VTSYKIRAGDIFLWGNFQTMHTATPIEYPDEDGKRRMLYRMSTNCIPDLYQEQQPASETAHGQTAEGGLHAQSERMK